MVKLTANEPVADSTDVAINPYIDTNFACDYDHNCLRAVEEAPGGLTDFEKKVKKAYHTRPTAAFISSASSYHVVRDVCSGAVLGCAFFSNTIEVYDRSGKLVAAINNERWLETPALDPVDFIGAGLAVKALKTLTDTLLARSSRSWRMRQHWKAWRPGLAGAPRALQKCFRCLSGGPPSGFYKESTALPGRGEISFLIRRSSQDRRCLLRALARRCSPVSVAPRRFPPRIPLEGEGMVLQELASPQIHEGGVGGDRGERKSPRRPALSLPAPRLVWH